MEDAKRPKPAIDAANQLSAKAANVVNVRNRFAHGPLDMGINLETRKFEMYSRRIGNSGKAVVFETVPLTEDDLKEVGPIARADQESAANGTKISADRP